MAPQGTGVSAPGEMAASPGFHRPTGHAPKTVAGGEGPGALPREEIPDVEQALAGNADDIVIEADLK